MYETVIENLKYLISEDCTENQMDYVADIELAIDALETLAPKTMPYNPFDIKTQYLCPRCRTYIVSFAARLCNNCGQFFKWECEK